MIDYLFSMTSDQVFGLFVPATLIVVALSAAASLFDFRENSDSLGVSVLLAMILYISMIVRSHPTAPGGVGTLVVFPVIDLAALCAVSLIFATRPGVWKFVVAFSFLAQLVAHFSFWRGWSIGNDTFPVYILLLNLLAAVSLLANGYAGARGVAVGLITHLSRGRHVGLRPLHHGPHP